MGNSELFKTALVSKKNILNEMKAENLTLQQIRFLIIYLSKINPLDESTRTVKFKLSSFQKIMEFGKLNTKRLKQSTDALQSIKVSVPRNTKNGYESIVLFSRCLVDKDSNGEWFVEMSASVEAMQYMFNLNKEYVKYQLWNILDLKSKHQFRMYEILKQHENQGKIEITIEKLRALLGIKDNQYQRFTHLRERVLEPCQKALKEKTDIYFDFEKGKSGTGREWRTIIFKIHPNIAKKALIESTAKEIKTTQQPQPTETYEKPKQYYQPKPYKPYTPRKRPVPSFENKQWDFDALQKMWDRTGEDDEDDEDISNNDSNSKKDIGFKEKGLYPSNNEYKKFNLDDLRKIIEETGDDEDEDISNNDSNSKKDIKKFNLDDLRKIIEGTGDDEDDLDDDINKLSKEMLNHG